MRRGLEGGVAEPWGGGGGCSLGLCFGVGWAFITLPRRISNLTALFQTPIYRPMIHVHELTKQYAGRTAVDRLSFDVEAGEIVGFLGPNGAGKSTTMRILSGYMPPT